MTKLNEPLAYDFKVDARGLSCPMPLLKMKQCLNKAASGQTVWLIATDPASRRDIQSFTNLSQYAFLISGSENIVETLVETFIDPSTNLSANEKQTDEIYKKVEKEFHFYITKA
jgi:tRNA 2-thiouridine synthesizing protein A